MYTKIRLGFFTCDSGQLEVLDGLARKAGDLCAQAEADHVDVLSMDGVLMEEAYEARQVAAHGEGVLSSGAIPGGGR